MNAPRAKFAKLFRAVLLLVVAVFALAWIAVSADEPTLNSPETAIANPIAGEGFVHVVAEGETLSGIAARYGSSAEAIALANGLRALSLVWPGSRLQIPGSSILVPRLIAEATPVPETPVAVSEQVTETLAAPPAEAADEGSEPAAATAEELAAPAQPSEGSAAPAQSSEGAQSSDNIPSEYVVQPGDTLSRIAARYGTSVAALAAANGLADPNRIYAGQRLRIASAGQAPTTAPPAAAEASASQGKWIEVDLSEQSLTAWVGITPVRRMLVSTGLPRTPTPVGRFTILSKYLSVPMSGPGYYLPGVPHTMYFYRGYAIHGTYWHNNFGRPMSHGCVNLSKPDAAWLYNWAPLGTPVVIHQ